MMPDFFQFSNIEYSEPAETAPTAYENTSFPYGQLDDRPFEELTYLVFRKKIEREGKFSSRHNRIHLMQGIGEKGRDCALFSGSEFSGIIQCKNYKNSILKGPCLEEIIKPLLHTIIGNLTISHPEKFEYFFVAPLGFAGPANDMLGSFSNFVDNNRPEIEKAVNRLKKDYKCFDQIEFATIEARLTGLLKAITIIPYTKADLDSELSLPENAGIVLSFFTVRAVTDNKAIEELKREISWQKNIPLDKIKDSFESASLQLSQYPDTLEGIPDSHIPRKETDKIISWIKTKLAKDAEPVLLLVGEPGGGKSVILKDVYSRLKEASKIVIGFKADRYYVSSVSDLQIRANLPDALEDCIRTLLRESDSVVVLIDQIDAVSQSVTSQRDCVDTYSQILHNLKRIPGVRIIVSIRRFELEYDFEFSDYKRRYQRVDVEPLSREEILRITRQLGMIDNMVSDNLETLLSVPNHLNIFCKIHKGAPHPASLTTLQGLYAELWRQKKQAYPGNIKEIEQAIFSLADELHRTHSLSIPANQFADTNAGRYLIRVGLVIQQGGYIQFFHQTFFDYAFAKSFIYRNTSVIGYVRKEQQSIYIRAALKMMLGFLRRENHSAYIAVVTGILTAHWVRWHLKSLVLNLLAFEDTPSADEFKIAVRYILKDRKLKLPFVEAVTGKHWLPLLIQHGVLEDLVDPKPDFWAQSKFSRLKNWLKKSKLIPENWLLQDFVKKREELLNTAYQLFRRNLPHNRMIVLSYLNKLGPIEHKSFFILRLLWLMQVWDNELSKELYLQHASQINDMGLKLMILEEVVSYDPKWVLDQLYPMIIDTFVVGGTELDNMTHHRFETVCEKLENESPEVYFSFCIKLIRTFIDMEGQHIYEVGLLQKTGDFTMIDYDHDGHASGRQWFLHSAIKAARKLCTEGSSVFRDFLMNLGSEKSTTILIIPLATLTENVHAFKDEAYALVKTTIENKGFLDEDLKFHLRNLIPKLFPTLKESEKLELGNIILGIRNPREIGVYEYNGNRRRYSAYGQLLFAFLSAIPESDRSKIPGVKRRFQELERRFKKTENTPPNRMTLRSIGTPIPSRAYNHLSLQDWEKSFKRYDDTYAPDFFSDKGGLEQHSRQFEQSVSENPDGFISLVRKIVEEDIVSRNYQIAGLNGLKKANYNPYIFLELYRILMTREHCNSGYQYTIWLASYIAESKQVDQEVFEFLYQKSVSYPEPQKPLNPDAPGFDSLNTVRGAAVHALMLCLYNEAYIDRIFDALEQIEGNASQSVRISALSRLAYLIRYDQKRTVSIFCRLVKSGDQSDVFLAGIHTAQYLARTEFAAVLAFLNGALKHKSCQRNASIILGVAWLTGKEEAWQALLQAWKEYPVSKASMIDVAMANYKNPAKVISNKSRELFYRFLSDTADEVLHEYATAFLKSTPHDFISLLPLFKKYSRSVVARKRPGYFFEYLLKCCREFPKECIDLLNTSAGYEVVDMTKAGYYDPDLPIKVLVGAYNSLNTTQHSDKRYLKKGLNLFDRLLQHPSFRNAAEKVMELA
jgi:hypothetical protein